MTAVRWVVEHPQDQLGTGGWVEYPDRESAEQHAGNAATVWCLVRPEAVSESASIERLKAIRSKAGIGEYARTDVPVLLAAVERLTAARDRATDHIGQLAHRLVVRSEESRKLRDHVALIGASLNKVIAERDAMRPVVEAAERDATFWFTVAVNTANRYGVNCPRCQHSIAIHWPDDERHRPGCQTRDLCSWTPQEILLALNPRPATTPPGPRCTCDWPPAVPGIPHRSWCELEGGPSEPPHATAAGTADPPQGDGKGEPAQAVSEASGKALRAEGGTDG